MRVFILLISLLWLPLSLTAAEVETYGDENSQVVVRYLQPDELTDLEIRRLAPERARAEFARAVQDWFRGPGSQLLGDRRLEIDIIDVEMAGEIQPWRTQHMDDIRFVDTLFPARLSFDYRLLDAEGNELSADHVDKRRFPRQGSRLSQRYQPFNYEIEILADWWRGLDHANG